MTDYDYRNMLYVAASSPELAIRFGRVNGVEPENVHHIVPGNPIRERRAGMTIFVIGEIGNAVAEEIHLFVTTRAARVRYVYASQVVDTLIKPLPRLLTRHVGREVL